MSDQSQPLPPPAGYDSWLEYSVSMTIGVLDESKGKCTVTGDQASAAAKAELWELRKSHAELELKCALAKAHVHNLKAALERISRLSSVTCLTFRDQSFHATEIAREALKGSTTQ